MKIGVMSQKMNTGNGVATMSDSLSGSRLGYWLEECETCRKETEHMEVLGGECVQCRKRTEAIKSVAGRHKCVRLSLDYMSVDLADSEIVRTECGIEVASGRSSATIMNDGIVSIHDDGYVLAIEIR